MVIDWPRLPLSRVRDGLGVSGDAVILSRLSRSGVRGGQTSPCWMGWSCPLKIRHKKLHADERDRDQYSSRVDVVVVRFLASARRHT